MDYVKKSTSEPPKPYDTPDTGAPLEVSEPPAYYGEVCGDGRLGAVAVVYDDNDDDDGDDGIDLDALPVPESITVRTLEELYSKVEEGRQALLEGRTIPLDEAVDSILRDIENGTI